MRQPFKILVFTNSIGVRTHTFIYDSVEALRKSNVDVGVVTVKRINGEVRPFENVVEIGKPSKWHPRRLASRLLAEFGYGEALTSDWHIIRNRLCHVIGRLKPDVIHAHFGPAGVLIAPVADEFNIPLVTTFHGYDISVLPQRAVWKRLYSPLFETASRLIGVSSHVASQLKAIGGVSEAKVKIVHNGVDLSRFAYSNCERETPHDRQVKCLFVGRLVEKKDPLGLLEAFSIARQKTKKDLHLTVIGNGPLKDEVETMIEREKMGEYVALCDGISHSEVASIMSRSDIYVQCCKTASNGDEEGLGMTILEASATGLPVVSTFHSGIQDAVRHRETALLAPESDYEAIAKHIIRLSSDSNLRSELGRNGRSSVEENFSISRHSEKMTRLYKNVVS